MGLASVIRPSLYGVTQEIGYTANTNYTRNLGALVPTNDEQGRRSFRSTADHRELLSLPHSCKGLTVRSNFV